MRRGKSVATALAVASIVVCMVGVASAGAAPSWNTQEPIQVPENGNKTVTLTVHDDINDESVDEVATITPTPGLEEHVELSQNEIHFNETDTSKQVEVVIEPTLEQNETAEGSLILTHGVQTEEGFSPVGVQYSFDMQIESTEPESDAGSSPVSGNSLPSIVGAGAIGAVAVISIIVWRRKRESAN